MLACEERDNHQLDKELLTNRLRHLEEEIEASKNNLNEKTREIRILEVNTCICSVRDSEEITMATELSTVYIVSNCTHCKFDSTCSHLFVKQIRLKRVTIKLILLLMLVSQYTQGASQWAAQC